jgi:hypothetical protein
MMKYVQFWVIVAVVSPLACASPTAQSSGMTNAAVAPAPGPEQEVDAAKLVDSWATATGRRVRLQGVVETWGSAANVYGLADAAMVDVTSGGQSIRCWLGARDEKVEALFETLEANKTKVVVRGTVDKDEYFLKSCALERAR